MATVQILLSTYNGERFVGELLESLLAQDYPDIEVLVRDDGSTDGTVRLLENYVKDGKIRLWREANIGVRASFYALVARSSQASRYYAFCDQDDVWSPGKISRAVNSLGSVPDHLPALYFTRTRIVDEHLNVIRESRLPRRPISIRNALVENVAPGCTIVFNRALRELLVNRLPLDHVGLHDSWMYLLAASFGRVLYDPVPSVLYRQHGGNVVGAQRRARDRYVRRIRGLLHRNRRHVFRLRARQFLNEYGDMLSDESRQIIQEFLNGTGPLHRRFRYALKPGVYRQTTLGNLALRVLILAGAI